MIKIIAHFNFTRALAVVAIGAMLLAGGGFAYASGTSNFQITINSGTLSVDIVNATYVTVGSPSVAFGAVNAAITCQTPGATGTFGTATQQIYVQNPDSADNGWTLSLAASAPTAFWDSAGTDMDFNDPTSSGCGDGADVDSLKGQLTVNASGGTLAVGQCTGGCGTGNITLGASSAYNQGTTDSITLLTAAAASSDIGDWTLQNVAVSQTIPAEQPAAADYDVNMVLSVVAS